MWKVVLMVAFLSGNGEAAPRPSSSGPQEAFYDQRQNGTENYRVTVDGAAVVVAPVEVLLMGAALLGPQAVALPPKPEDPEDDASNQQNHIQQGQTPIQHLTLDQLAAEFLVPLNFTSLFGLRQNPLKTKFRFGSYMQRKKKRKTHQDRSVSTKE